jgi:hypothetical protein
MKPSLSTGRARALSFAAAAWFATGLQGCPSRCSETFELIDVELTGAVQGLSCDVQFVNGSRIAQYKVAAPLTRDGGTARPGACIESDQGPQVPCTAVSGPAFSSPTHCNRTYCGFGLVLSGADAHAVADFLGSNTFDLTLTCEGVVVVSNKKETFQTQVCGL